jgi:hypothetical protein
MLSPPSGKTVSLPHMRRTKRLSGTVLIYWYFPFDTLSTFEQQKTVNHYF